jgi:hypothetical protein
MGLHKGRPRLTDEGYVSLDVHKGAAPNIFTRGVSGETKEASERVGNGWRRSVDGANTAVSVWRPVRRLQLFRDPSRVRARCFAQANAQRADFATFPM